MQNGRITNAEAMVSKFRSNQWSDADQRLGDELALVREQAPNAH
jgi:hypothetical protein